MKKLFSVILSLIMIFGLFGTVCTADSARATVLINGDTGEVLYAKNADMRLPMASTTKIMTALILCETVDDLEEKTTVNNDAATLEGTSMGLKAGDSISYKALLYGMLLSSGNDAAHATAYALGGTVSDFAVMMNKKAADLGLYDTNFVTPSGLDAEGHYTTAHDLALLTRAALKNKRFSAAAKTESITLCYGTPEVSHTLKNHNRLLSEREDVIGVKTGFTDSAGRCLVSAAKNDGKYLICVTLNDKNDWNDHKELLDSGYLMLKEQTSENVRSLDIPLSVGGKITLYIPKLKYYSASDKKLSVKTVTPKMIYPAVKKGEGLGYAYYYYEHKKIKAVKLTAPSNINNKKSTPQEQIFSLFKAALYVL